MFCHYERLYMRCHTHPNCTRQKIKHFLFTSLMGFSPSMPQPWKASHTNGSSVHPFLPCMSTSVKTEFHTSCFLCGCGLVQIQHSAGLPDACPGTINKRHLAQQVLHRVLWGACLVPGENPDERSHTQRPGGTNSGNSSPLAISMIPSDLD